MKLMIIFGLLLSSSAFARQYIQCADSNSFERAVINLNDNQSTLFMTNGVHLPDEQRVEVLKDLNEVNTDENFTTFETNLGNVQDILKIPTAIIGEFSSYFQVELTHKRIDSGYERSRVMSCYSAIYED